MMYIEVRHSPIRCQHSTVRSITMRLQLSLLPILINVATGQLWKRLKSSRRCGNVAAMGETSRVRLLKVK